MATVRIGISGWRYPGWRGVFYPKGLPQRAELSYAAEHLTSIEINGTFYALQRPSSFVTWRESTSDDMVFAVKAPRFITHLKRLLDVQAPLANLFASGILALGPKLGPLLWQLPPNFVFDADRLAAFFDELPRNTSAAAALAGRHDERVPDDRALLETDADRPLRHALEFRHPSFAEPQSVALHRAHGIALVAADAAGSLPLVEVATADFRYVRLHGPTEMYASGYPPAELDRWAAKIRDWADDRDVYVYCDNDAKAHAPFDAMGLIERVGQQSGRARAVGPETLER